MQGFDPFLPCNSHHVTSRRRIHIQNVGQQGQSSANGSERQQRHAQQRERSTAAGNGGAGGGGGENAAAQNFHRNLVYTISEAVMDAFNSAQLTRMHGPDGGSRAAAGGGGNASGQSGARMPRAAEGFPMPPILNLVISSTFIAFSMFKSVEIKH